MKLSDRASGLLRKMELQILTRHSKEVKWQDMERIFGRLASVEEIFAFVRGLHSKLFLEKTPEIEVRAKKMLEKHVEEYLNKYFCYLYNVHEWQTQRT
ncbi:hypothetical protein TNCT_398921 [Trichonephila clavata]|uniref:Uncharacterized protein n=1 Tax=Trichonephila clavata TaxID=2740835 RepID=A0A8X6JAU9_TRICU|nr:hypothetical protein TNCT_398921 [Trichonephila clavata]